MTIKMIFVFLKTKKNGYILISTTVFSVLLLSIAALIYYKSIFVDNFYKSWLQRRTLFLEIDSLLVELNKRLTELTPEEVKMEKKNFLQIIIDGQERWIIDKKANDITSDPILFDFYYIPKKQNFRRSLLYNP